MRRLRDVRAGNYARIDAVTGFLGVKLVGRSPLTARAADFRRAVLSARGTPLPQPLPAIPGAGRQNAMLTEFYCSCNDDAGRRRVARLLSGRAAAAADELKFIALLCICRGSVRGSSAGYHAVSAKGSSSAAPPTLSNSGPPCCRTFSSMLLSRRTSAPSCRCPQRRG